MKKVGLLSIVIGLVFVSYSNALGCVCMLQPDVKKAIVYEFNSVPLVFSGKVIAAEYRPIIKKDAWGKEIKAQALVYRFSIDKLWKGKANSEVILNTYVYKYDDISVSSTCDFDFKVGEQYLVYAIANQEGNLQTNGCSRTNLLKNARRDIKEIKKLNNKIKH